ncbi:sterol desaturase family protein [Polaromonas sp.]|uniref:sterol desaturase family protein n=1 Tax=Polaromonas sp. TaxID=1869339 RepID=UPI0032668923
MGLLNLEQSRCAYIADFTFYGTTVMALAIVLVFYEPASQRLPLGGIVLAGLASWTLIEYLLHRFVLHGLQPFKRWHAEHHDRPTALICTPTALSASLIAALVFLPALLLGGLWRASALTLGVLVGYLTYAITHHATHHWRSRTGWMLQRKRLHALHHSAKRQPQCFGVSSALWDHMLGTQARPPVGLFPGPLGNSESVFNQKEQ